MISKEFQFAVLTEKSLGKLFYWLEYYYGFVVIHDLYINQ